MGKKITKTVAGVRRSAPRPVEGLDGLPPVTARQLSDLFVVSESAIVSLASSGMFKPLKRKQKSAGVYFDLIASTQAYCHFKNQAKKVSDPDARIKAARSREIEIRTAQREAKVIELDEAILFTDFLVGSFRASLSGLPSRVTRDLKLRAVMNDAINGILQTLSDEQAKKAKMLRDGESLIEKEVEEGEDLSEDDESE